MTTAMKKLTLVCPPATGDQIVEFLIESDSLVHGFTTSAANGHGHDFATASVGERVRGHVRRMSIALIVEDGGVSELIAQLKNKFPSPHVVYWTEAVDDFGVFS
jgi:hypothetical protein